MELEKEKENETEIEINSDFKKYGKIRQLGHEENSEIFTNPDDEIVIQEKIDGANFRFMIEGGELIFGTRSRQLSMDDEKDIKSWLRCIE